MSTWIELTEIKEVEVVAWAREHCPSFCSWLIYDDDLLHLDIDPTRYRFEFRNEQDAVLFQLRWQGQ